MKSFLSKYSRLINKFIGNVVRPRFGIKKKITKWIKIPYLLIEFPLEIIGDIFFIWKKRHQAISAPKKILIIKIDQFGDVLFSTFLLPRIKAQHPNIQIDMVINPKTETILKNNPYIGKCWHWNDPFMYFLLGRNDARGNFFKLCKQCISLLRILRREQYDIVINTRAYPPSSNIFWKLISPRCLIAFDISEQSFLADYWAPYDLYEEEWKNYFHLIKPFCPELEEIYEPGIYAFDDARALQKLPVLREKARNVVVISPVSFDVERYLPEATWRVVIRGLIEKEYIPVITGMPSQKSYIDTLTSGIDGEYHIATSLSLSELVSVYKMSAFFIGIDSFPAHLAIALGKVSFCFVNPHYYYLKGYSHKRWIDARCMLPLIERFQILPVQTTDAVKLLQSIDMHQRTHLID